MEQPIVRLMLGLYFMTGGAVAIWLLYRRWVVHAGRRTRFDAALEAAFDRVRATLPGIPTLGWYVRVGAIIAGVMLVAGVILTISAAF